MLKDNFYTISNIEHQQDHISAEIKLNSGHEIFKGHFPGMPVVPGVCQLEIIKEILCYKREGNYLMDTAKSCKFLNMINPLEVSSLNCEIDLTRSNEKKMTFSASISDSNRTYFKIKGELTRIND